MLCWKWCAALALCILVAFPCFGADSFAAAGIESPFQSKTFKLSGKPGEESITPGNHRGVLRKSLHGRVIGQEMPVELEVEASILSHVALSSHELVWKDTEKPEAKSIEIQSGTGNPFSITGLLGVPEEQFTIFSETVEEKTHYRFSITPTSDAAGQDCLQVRADSPDPRDAVQDVFLRFDKSPPTAYGP